MAGWDQKCYKATDRPSITQSDPHLLLIQARMKLRLPKETAWGKLSKTSHRLQIVCQKQAKIPGEKREEELNWSHAGDICVSPKPALPYLAWVWTGTHRWP